MGFTTNNIINIANYAFFHVNFFPLAFFIYEWNEFGEKLAIIASRIV